MARRDIKPNFKFPTVSTKFGLSLRASYAGTPTYQEEIILVNITGPGKVASGFISAVGTDASHNADWPTLYIDDVSIFAPNFKWLDDFSIVNRFLAPLHIVHYDDLTFTYNVGIAAGLQFDSSLKLTYTNWTYEDEVLVRARVFYLPKEVVW